jgi:hypothetical protein
VTQCYMCFDDEDTEENPLVAPCLCKGGTRYVHVECLQKWQCAAADDKVGGSTWRSSCDLSFALTPRPCAPGVRGVDGGREEHLQGVQVAVQDARARQGRPDRAPHGAPAPGALHLLPRGDTVRVSLGRLKRSI